MGVCDDPKYFYDYINGLLKGMGVDHAKLGKDYQCLLCTDMMRCVDHAKERHLLQPCTGVNKSQNVCLLSELAAKKLTVAQLAVLALDTCVAIDCQSLTSPCICLNALGCFACYPYIVQKDHACLLLECHSYVVVYSNTHKHADQHDSITHTLIRLLHTGW